MALVTCQFEKAKLDVKVVFNRSRQISGLFFVPARSAAEYQRPTYADPSTFQEREVQVGTRPWALPGTLTIPVGNGPFPAIVLVHGSGPNDRDENDRSQQAVSGPGARSGVAGNCRLAL